MQLAGRLSVLYEIARAFIESVVLWRGLGMPCSASRPEVDRVTCPVQGTVFGRPYHLVAELIRWKLFQLRSSHTPARRRARRMMSRLAAVLALVTAENL